MADTIVDADEITGNTFRKVPAVMEELSLRIPIRSRLWELHAFAGRMVRFFVAGAPSLLVWCYKQYAVIDPQK